MAMMFERQDRESDKAFAAFSLYLNLGPQRSIRVVAEKLAKSEQLIRRWSAKYDWPARVAAHGAYLATVEREAVTVLARDKAVEWAQREEEQREEEWRWRTELLEVARDILTRWRAHPDRFESIASLAKVLELASKLGRLSSGLATEHQEHSGPDGRPIPLEITAALDKIYGPKAAEVSEPARPIIDIETTPR